MGDNLDLSAILVSAILVSMRSDTLNYLQPAIHPFSYPDGPSRVPNLIQSESS